MTYCHFNKKPGVWWMKLFMEKYSHLKTVIKIMYAIYHLQ